MIETKKGKFYHNGMEITEAEYNELLMMIKAKAALVEEIIAGTKTLGECPEEWQEEIEQRVEARQAEQEPDPSPEEALSFLLGGVQI